MLSKQLHIAYEKQMEKFSSYLLSYEPVAEMMIRSVVGQFSLDSIEGKVSITETPSLFFTILFEGGKRLHFECFLATRKVAYSLYKNKELEARNHGDFTEMIFDADSHVYKKDEL